MVNYSLGASRNASNQDGVGTELATTDTVTTNAYTETFDAPWTNRACDDVTVSLNGQLINEAGVDVVWDAGAIITSNSIIEIRGTSSSTVTWSNFAYILDNHSKSIIYANYWIMLNPTSWGIAENKGNGFIFNSTLTSGDGVFGVLIGKGGFWYIENSNITSAASTGAFRIGGVFLSAVVYLVDCTITNTHANNKWVQIEDYCTVYILGTTNFEGAECTNANATYNTKPNVYYYSRMKVTVDEGSNPLENATAPMYHKVGKGHIIFSLASIRPPNFYGGRYKEMDTDASGIVRCFALSKVYLQGTWKYISDENQAETGDNAPYLVNAMYPNLQSPSSNTEAWAIETGNNNLDETDVGTISVSVVGTISISNQELSDYAITTSETSTASCTITGTPDGVWVHVNGKPFALRNFGAGSWQGTVYGSRVSVCTNQEVLFVAGDVGGGKVEAAPSNLTVTASAVKVNPDPLETIYEMVKAGWDKTKTDNILPDFIAKVGDQDGLKKFSFKEDTIVMYVINIAEKDKGTGYDHINRTDVVAVDMHTNGTRAHYQKMVDMLKSLLYAERKNPTTYPLNTDYTYDALYFDPLGQTFDDKYSGHRRLVLNIKLHTFWENII